MRKICVVLLLTALIGTGVLFVVQPWEGVTVAIMFPASGVGASWTLSLTQSLLLAFDYFNERPFAPKYCPIVIQTDDIEEGVKEAIDSGAVVIMGASTSTYASRLQKAAEEAGLSVISVGALSQALSAKDNFFRPHSGVGEAFAMGKKLARPGLDYAVCVSAQNPIYVVPFLDALIAEIGGIRPVLYLIADGGISKEVLFSVFAKIMETSCIVLVLPDFSAATVTKELRYAYFMPILVASWGATTRFVALVGSMGEGVRTIASWRPDVFETPHPFVEYVTKLYGDELEPYAITMAYDAVAMLDSAVNKGGNDRSSMKERLGEIHSLEGINGPFSVDENGDGHPLLYFQEVSDKRWRLLEVVTP